MNKPILLSAITSLFVIAALVFMAEGSKEARASLPPFHEVDIAKSGRLALADSFVNGEDDDADYAEWTLDCLDQFGPNGASPNTTNLHACMNQPG